MKKQKVHDDPQGSESEFSYNERQQIVNAAKIGVRSRRGRRMQVSLSLAKSLMCSLT